MTEKRKLKLKTDPRNARIHPPRNLKAVKRSLDELGAGRSIVVDRSGVAIGGSAVLEKAVELGLDMELVHTKGDKLIVVVRDDLATDDPRRKALALADNQIALLAEWDLPLLEEIKLEIEEIDLDVMGFEEPDEPIREPQDPSELIDRAEELQKKWKVKRAQIWEIPSKTVSGKSHRVMCGDSKKAADIKRLMAKERMDVLFTDPPYGISIVKGMIKGSIGGAKPFGRVRQPGGKASGVLGGKGLVEPGVYPVITGDDKPFDPIPFLNCADTLIIFGANHFASRLPDSKGWIVWDKGVAPNSTFSDAELLWTNRDEHIRMYRHVWSGLVREGERAVEGESRWHPTQKPVGLLAAILNDFSTVGDKVYDPFLGSGTTVVAAEQEGRIAFGMEIEPRYVSVTLERLFALGLKPHLVKKQ